MINSHMALIVALTLLLCVVYAKQGSPMDATGTVEIVSVDDFENQREETQYRLHDETTGQRFNLMFGDKAPVGMRTGDRLRVRGQHLNNTLTVAALGGLADVQTLQSAPVMAAASGEQHMIVILLSFTNAACTYTPSTVSNWLFRTSGGNSVDSAYRESSLGAMWFTGTVVGPYVINADVNVYDDDKWRTLGNAAATAAGVNLNLYNRRVYTTDDFKAAGWAGLGTVGGEPSWAMIKNANATVVYVHELGHNVGMGHSGTDSNNDGVIEDAYGDNSCPMGSPYAWREFNAAYKVLMGWMAPTKIIANPASGTYTLAGIENDFATLTDKRLITIAVPGSSWPYYLSFKIPVGYDATLGTTYSDKLFIQRFQKVEGGASRLIDTLVDNDTFSETNVGFRVTQLSHTTSNVTIRLAYFSDDVATWKTTAASAVWSALSSWTLAVVPDYGATVIFGTGGSTSVVDTVSRTVGSIIFNRASNFTINATGGGGLTVNDGITVSNNFTHTINAPVILGNNNTWLVTGTGPLRVGGAISGDFPLIKTGPGTLILGGTNSYTGTTTVDGGNLVLAGGGSVTQTTSIAVLSGAQLTVIGTGNVLGDTSLVQLYSGAKVYLTNGVAETVGALGIDGQPAAAGTWGTANCQWTNTALFAGSGVLTVTSLATNLPPRSWYSRGSITWDNGLTSNQWSGVSGGALNQIWLSANDAVFETTAGTASVGAGGVTAHDVTFNVSGYTLANNTLTLNGVAPAISIATGTATISSSIAGAAGLTKAGAGTLTLSGACAYSGGTTLSGGTLVLSGGTNRLLNTGTLNFSDSSAMTLSNVSQTLVTITVADNKTGTITGRGGALTLTGSSFSLGGTTVYDTQTLDLSGLGMFSYTNSGGTFQVSGRFVDSVNSDKNSYGVLTLAATNTITAATVNVGSPGSSGQGNLNYQKGTVNLGPANTINARTINIGTGAYGFGVVSFRPGLLGTPVLAIRGVTGGSTRADMTVGSNVGGQSTFTTLCDLATNYIGGTGLDARLGTMRIAYANRASNALAQNVSAVFTMGGGLMDATNIIIGADLVYEISPGTASGTFNLGVDNGAPGGTVKVATLTMGDRFGTGSITSTFNLNHGGTLAAKSIQAGAGVATRTFNWNDGTIAAYGSGTNLSISGVDLTLGADGSHVFDSGVDAITVASTVDINGSGALTKIGSGMLTLSGANTYSGTTTISGGTLLVSNTSGSGTGLGAVQVASGGSLGGTGIIGGTVTITNGGVLSPGPLTDTGTLTLSNALTLTSGSVLQYALGASNDLAVVQGALTLDGILNITDAGGFGVGTYTLFTYMGLLTNNGLTIGTKPDASLVYTVDTSTAGHVKLLVTPTDSAVWTNPASAGNWSNPLSWNPSVLPATGADVIFGTGGSTSVVDTVSRTVGSILFNRAGNFTLDASGGGVLTIHDGITASNNLADTIDAPVILSNTNTWLVAGTSSFLVGGAISGDFPLIKTGTGALTLSATNTFMGGMTLLAGTLNVSSDSNLGGTNSPNPITLNGGTLIVTKPFTLTVNHPLVIGASGGSINAGGGNTITLASTNTLTGSGTLNLAGSGSTVSVLAISAAQKIAGAININSGRIVVNGAAGTLGTGPVTIGTGSASLYLSVAGITLNNAAINIQSNGGENRGAIRFAGGGTMTSNLVLLANAGLSQEGTSTANLNGNISGGFTLQLNGLTSSGTGTWNLGGSNSVTGLTVAGGIVNANAPNALGTGGLVLTVNGGTLNLNTRSVTVSRLTGAGGTITDSSAGVGTTMLTANQSATTTVASVIQNGGVKLLALTKAGSGTLTLSGTNTYTGATTISAGTLLVSGSLAASAVSVASNSTLSGTGTIGGAVTINAGGIFAPGPLTGTGTLTLGNALAMASSTRLHYGLGTSSDLAAVTGALTLRGTLDITDAGGFGIGIYTLFTYTGALTTTGLTIGTKPDVSLVYTLDTNTVGRVRLVVQSAQFVAWQVQYFGSATLPQAQPDADPDNDRLSNAQEFQAGTNPKLSSSVLAITDTYSFTNGTFSVMWQSVSGKTYRVAYAPSLTNTWLTNLPNSVLTSTGQTTLVYVDEIPIPATNRFYKINLVP